MNPYIHYYESTWRQPKVDISFPPSEPPTSEAPELLKRTKKLASVKKSKPKSPLVLVKPRTRALKPRRTKEHHSEFPESLVRFATRDFPTETIMNEMDALAVPGHSKRFK